MILTSEKSGTHSLYEIITVFILFLSLGFPGNYKVFLGEKLCMLLEYGAFVLELLIMLLSSGESFLEVRIVNIRFCYRAIYLLVAVFFAESMAVTRYPQEQLITCLRFSTTVFFALWLLDHFGIRRTLELILYAQAGIVAASLFLMVAAPGTAFSSEQSAHDFIGLLNAKNSAASEFSCGILIQSILLRCRMQEKQPVSQRFIILLVLQIILLLMCHATGPVIFVLIPLVYLFRIEPRRDEQHRLHIGLDYILVSVSFLIVALTILPLFTPILNALGKDATLTGRTVLWNRIIEMMTQSHTFTGYGYEMFWRDTRAVAEYHAGFEENSWGATMTTGAHNVLLEFWLNVGLIGIAAFFVMILDATRRIREVPEQQYLFTSTFLMHAALHGLTERAFGTYNYFTLFFFLAVAAACKRPEGRILENHPGKETGEDIGHGVRRTGSGKSDSEYSAAGHGLYVGAAGAERKGL